MRNVRTFVSIAMSLLPAVAPRSDRRDVVMKWKRVELGIAMHRRGTRAGNCLVLLSLQ